VDPKILVADIRAQPLETGLSHALLTRMVHRDRGRQPGAAVPEPARLLTGADLPRLRLDQRMPRCDARMTLHRGRALLVCHHCGLEHAQPVRCPYCQSPDLRPLGQGTERVEDTLRQRFPGIPLARIDRDSTRRKGELERLLAAAQRGEHRILLGTQMLAKGHHLPGITLVGILDLDHGLYGSDFRATERMAQLLMQVAGRAGRAERPGTVMLQTRHPRHPMLSCCCARATAPSPTAALPSAGRPTCRPSATRPCCAPTAPWTAPPWSSCLRALKRPRELRWAIDVDPQDGY
jgi:primosomal protein N' (replication factor Y)